MQIITFRGLLCALILPVTLSIGGYALGQDHKSFLEYSKNASANPSSVPLIAPDGTKYTLRLIPENDVGHHVVVLDVSLSRSNGKESKSNLLEPQGRWHGYQPYIFAASDFAQGGNGSQGQNSRTIDLPALGMQIEIAVTEVKVDPTPPSSSSKELPYQFTDLALEITTKSLPRQSSEKHPGK